jgi:hypothetical protein
VGSFIRLHERGFNTPASKCMRGLCYHYGVELHNFAPNYHYGVEVHNFPPNSISQASTFVGVCKGFFGVLVSWDLWLHLLRGELFTASGGKGKRRPVHVGGLTFRCGAGDSTCTLPAT